MLRSQMRPGDGAALRPGRQHARQQVTFSFFAFSTFLGLGTRCGCRCRFEEAACKARRAEGKRLLLTPCPKKRFSQVGCIFSWNGRKYLSRVFPDAKESCWKDQWLSSDKMYFDCCGTLIHVIRFQTQKPSLTITTILHDSLPRFLLGVCILPGSELRFQ